MSYVVMKPAWEAQLDCAPKIILISLADQANDDGECYPSVAHLEKRTGLSRMSIFRHLITLEKAGHITRNKRDGRSTVYHVHPVSNDQTRINLIPVSKRHPYQVDTPPVSKRYDPRINVIPIIINESLNNNKDIDEPVKTTKKQPKQKLQHVAKPEDVSDQVWNDYLAIRNKKIVSSTALAVIRNQAQKAGITLQTALETCCARGWQGFRADWVKDEFKNDFANDINYQSTATLTRTR